MGSNAVIRTKLGDREPDFSGKVRDIYDLGETLLIVATDRLSAFDHILPNPIPGRGKVLTQLSVFWFEKTKHIVDNHLITADVSEYPDWLSEYREQLEGRSMLVDKAQRIDVECVVRGYLAGSGWKDYKNTGKICGIQLPAGLVESQKLPEPIFTPATKAQLGEHDENISFEKLADSIGYDIAEKLRRMSIKLYEFAHNYAYSRGIIIADTKFEFGVLGDQIILIDEIFTPDSSRFWDKNLYRSGEHQEAFDKQFIRDYLLSVGWSGDGEPPQIPDDIIQKTIERYRQVAERIIGGKIE
ncbi:phosphoribosylaminoimidazolesuccinocarboxamide synthase [bacterium]|nr:phosphoribosylaminoimidazolesuccinocarboxamide synthase [bacterium]